MHTTISLYSHPRASCQPVCSPVNWSIPSSEEFSSQKSRCFLFFPINLSPCPVYAPPKQYSEYIYFSMIPLPPPKSSHQCFLDFFSSPLVGPAFIPLHHFQIHYSVATGIFKVHKSYVLHPYLKSPIFFSSNIKYNLLSLVYQVLYDLDPAFLSDFIMYPSTYNAYYVSYSLLYNSIEI